MNPTLKEVSKALYLEYCKEIGKVPITEKEIKAKKNLEKFKDRFF